MSGKKEKKFWKSHFGIEDPAAIPDEFDRLSYKESSLRDEELYFSAAD